MLSAGGAERLVVDAALGLQQAGHEVSIYTSYHDPQHCFEPTKDGTLEVHVVRTIIPRSFMGLFHLPLAIAQQLSLTFQLVLAFITFAYPATLPSFIYPLFSSVKPTQPLDIIFMDQLPAGVPWIRHITGTRIVYYCHYPDKEIGNSIAIQRARDRGNSGPSVLRKFYRIPFDLYEEGCTDSADKILVNSEFTQKQFQASFYRLRRQPRVLYPGIDVSTYDVKKIEKAVAALEVSTPDQKLIKDVCTGSASNKKATFISINRFEAKKNVALALESFAFARKEIEEAHGEQAAKEMQLVLAGGWDHRVRDNVLTLEELQKQCKKLGLESATLRFKRQTREKASSSDNVSSETVASAQVIFLPSLPGPLLHALLQNPSVKALLYTPTNEHFGIVPLEAMASGVPVLATNTGGPMESVVDASVLLGLQSFRHQTTMDGEKGGNARADKKEAQVTATNEAEAQEERSRTSGTGLLRQANKMIWSNAIVQLYEIDEETRAKLAENARRRVKMNFSLERMTLNLDAIMREVSKQGKVRGDEGFFQWASTGGCE